VNELESRLLEFLYTFTERPTGGFKGMLPAV
jgi:hypothetical protein